VINIDHHYLPRVADGNPADHFRHPAFPGILI
jgi:hypothetical protein